MRPPELFPLFADIASLDGVGKKVAGLLGKLLRRGVLILHGEEVVPQVRDLLFHLPVDIIDRTYSPPLVQARQGEIVTLKVMIEAHYPPKGRGRRGPHRVTCGNESGSLTLVFFHGDREWIERQLPVGQERAISGRLELYDGTLQMPHPDIIAPAAQFEAIQSIEPVYPLTAGLTSRRLSGWIAQGLKPVPELPEWLEASYCKQQGWPGWKAALTAAHHPVSKAALMPDASERMRLAADELLAGQLALGLIRTHLKSVPGIAIEARKAQAAEHVQAALPFTLTAGQEAVLADIRRDLAGGERMLRLLQGDVGSGKTVVALLAMLNAVDAGYQGALMAPTEILARQHYRTLATLLEGSRVRVALLTGSIKSKERTATLAQIEAGHAQIVVGTHALFQEQVAFHRLGFITIDEQHRFGVMQRMALAEKGTRPHVLLMTATPIPRSLMMVMYGDMDTSSLREKPAGRPEITTRAIPLPRLPEVMEAVGRVLSDNLEKNPEIKHHCHPRESGDPERMMRLDPRFRGDDKKNGNSEKNKPVTNISKGAKVYWLCPLVEESEDIKTSSQAAEERHKVLHARFGARVGLVHGRMKAEERQRVMQGFAGEEYDMLVATTVIEVGVDVPEATIMIIENAEHFGLSQLHQLRGRVGRSDKASSCLLLYDPACTGLALERLTIIRNETDGFVIAEEDLRLRGGGEVLGTRQSGAPDFLFADLYRHREIVSAMRDDVQLLLERDPHLTTERGKALRLLLALFNHERSMKWLEKG